MSLDLTREPTTAAEIFARAKEVRARIEQRHTETAGRLVALNAEQLAAASEERLLAAELKAAEIEERDRLLAKHPLEGPRKAVIGCRAIIKLVCEYFSIDDDEMMSDRRDAQLVYARQLGMLLCHRHTGATSGTIGKRFNRDHSTVLHGIEKLEDLEKTTPRIARQIEYLSNVIKAGL